MFPAFTLYLSPTARANLSQDYFTDRQDRYILFSDSHNLANYFSKLASAVATHAYSVGSDASLRPELQFDHITSTRKSQKFRKMMSAYFKEFLVNIHKDGDLWSHDVSCDAEGGGGYDTAVFPLLQMGQYDVRQEEDVTTRLLEGVGRGERLCLASGYFNLPPQYIRALLRAAGHISILAASPQVLYTPTGDPPIRTHFALFLSGCGLVIRTPFALFLSGCGPCQDTFFSISEWIWPVLPYTLYMYIHVQFKYKYIIRTCRLG